MRIRLSFLTLFISLSVLAQDQILIPFESNWRYLDNGSNQGTAWRTIPYDDSQWALGQAILGYGEGNENTVISFGPDPDNKYITTYFRHHFTIDDLSVFKNFLLKIQKDDGAIVYVNGQDVMRSNFGKNTYDYLDYAYSTISGEEEDIIWEEIIPASFFQDGENVIAVEVHQRSSSSSDLIFDLELTGLDSVPGLYREPYLQMATPEGITIKWKTDVPTDSRVSFGANVNMLSNMVSSAAMTTNHEVEITGLAPNTTYFYKVGNAAMDFTGGTPDFNFTTAPPIGTIKPTRIWITGDAGTGKDEQKDVRDSYLNFIGADQPSDLWLMMGDNAYEHGREADYHMGLFTVYQPILRNTVSYPTTGNHDLLAETSAITETGTFYDIFALPSNGECGGIPSGTESYFSVDYGNIHIVNLESTDLSRDSTGPMATWLKEDLQNTTADWLIAYWHFAPYTKVDHNSDDPSDWSGRAIEMRENINPILEKYGVDLILAGHSHGYERSYLLDGHYGYSNTLTQDMILDNSSGNLNLNEAYSKPKSLSSHKGAVYLVCGNSGKLGSVVDDGPFPGTHPVMYQTNTSFAGSVIIDIIGDTLEGKFLNENGIIQDYFHIIKGGVVSASVALQPLYFKLFPNPVEDHVNIFLIDDKFRGPWDLMFYNTEGKLLKRVSVDHQGYGKEGQRIDLQGFSPGIYTVKLMADGRLVGSRLMVVK